MIYEVQDLNLETLGAHNITPKENDCFVVSNCSKTYLYRYINGEFRELHIPKNHPIPGKYNEHHFFNDMFFDDSVRIINISGPAGSGKSFMSIGNAITALQREDYNKVIIIRELVPATEHKMGFLPGKMSEKLAPMFEAVMDTAEALSDTKLFRRDPVEEVKELIRAGKIEFSTMQFYRGRNLRNTLIICDDAQNLDWKRLKTIITRMSKGSKLIINGDNSQIDDKKVITSGADFMDLIGQDKPDYGTIVFSHSECRDDIVAKVLRWEQEYLTRSNND